MKQSVMETVCLGLMEVTLSIFLLRNICVDGNYSCLFPYFCRKDTVSYFKYNLI